MTLSVLIPTLNEEDFIGKTIDRLLESAIHQVEIIVVDTGSLDSTLEVVQTFPNVKVLNAPEFLGEKFQALNEASKQATGDVLLFLDADTLVPKGFDKLIRQSVQNGAIGGAFKLKFDVTTPSLECIRFFNEVRYLLTQNYFSDQGIFCSKQAFEQVGGFPPKPILADSALCGLLKKRGRLELLDASVTTSSRRFMNGGVLSVFRKDLNILLRDRFGMSTKDKAANYWNENRDYSTNS